MSFRPLTGINFNQGHRKRNEDDNGFRPLTGINFNKPNFARWKMPLVSVPSRG